jgi:hypothetical protein
MIEIWRWIHGYNKKYMVNNNGVIISIIKEKQLLVNSRIDRAGYNTVRLNINGQTHTRYIHRIVAMAFVPNHMGKPFVNHLNGNKLDNRPKNLEWVTHAENIQHAHDLRLITRPSERKVIDTCTNKVYPSIKEASKHTGLPYSTTKGYLKGPRRNKTCLKYLDN